MANSGDRIINGISSIPNDAINDASRVIPPWRRKIPEIETQSKNINTVSYLPRTYL